MVVFFVGGRADVPPDSVRDAEFGRDFPGVAHMEVPQLGAAVIVVDRVEGRVTVVNQSEQEAGDRVAAVDAEQAGGYIGESECP